MLSTKCNFVQFSQVSKKPHLTRKELSENHKCLPSFCLIFLCHDLKNKKKYLLISRKLILSSLELNCTKYA